jgi:hypothetical protein
MRQALQLLKKFRNLPRFFRERIGKISAVIQPTALN